MAQAVEEKEDVNQNLQYKWKIDINFDMDNNRIVLKVKEEISERRWSKFMTTDDVDGDIKEEYMKLGKAIANGDCDYVYPVDSGALKTTIKYENDVYQLSIPQDY